MKKANASTFDSVDQAAWSSLPSPGVRQSRVCWEESPGPWSMVCLLVRASCSMLR